MDRRTFLAGCAALAGLEAARTAWSAEPANTGLTTIAYNCLACKGYPRTPGNGWRLDAAAGQMPRRLALELSLYGPDVVTLPEAPSEEAVRELGGLLGMEHAVFRSPAGFPGALLSRFPFLEWTDRPLPPSHAADTSLFTRHCGRARLDTPGGALTVYSVHMDPHSGPLRLREIEALLISVNEDEKAGRSIIVQGDFNHRPDSAEYALWKEAGFTDAFAAKGTGQPQTANTRKPGVRIDYVMALGPIAAGLRECRVLFEGAFRLNPDDPASFALSDHLPVMARFG